MPNWLLALNLASDYWTARAVSPDQGCHNVSVVPSKSAALIPRDEVGCGVMVGVGEGVAGGLVEVGLGSGVALTKVGAGVG